MDKNPPSLDNPSKGSYRTVLDRRQRGDSAQPLLVGTMTVDGLFQFLAVAICACLLAWISVGLAHSMQSMVQTRRRFTLNQELLRQQVAAATQRATQAQQVGWDGWRKFRIKWKAREAEDCYSFYLVPHDGKPLPDFQPGQYLTLSVRFPGEVKGVLRCYSLSDRPRPDYFRLTIKTVRHADGSVGRVSQHLNETAREGDILDVASPKGPFTLDVHHDRPLVLLGAGIGITPLMSMLHSIATGNPSREVWLFYGVRNGADHVFQERLRTLRQELPHLQVTTCYSRPRDADRPGQDYDLHGRVTLGLLQEKLPASNYSFYMCGPEAFTSDLLDGLLAWHVPESDIHYEAFGPAKPRRGLTGAAASPAEHQIDFARTGCQAVWRQPQTLLELAEQQGVVLESGCRAGSCGACLTAIKSGRVQHSPHPGTPVPPGSCLPCVAYPDGPVTLDA